MTDLIPFKTAPFHHFFAWIRRTACWAGWGGLVFLLGSCNQHFLEGQFLERQKRWEEAAISYHLALVEDPDDSEIREALQRSNRVVSRENFQRYQDFLARKSFKKAYNRLVDAAKQDPDFEPVKKEMKKWDRILVSGQVRFEFETAQTSLALADQVNLIVRINTPNPGKTIDAVVDVDTGYFFAEDLLYDRPNELLAYYSINSVGASMVFGRSRIKRFTSREYQQFIRFRTPIVDDLEGTLRPNNKGPVKTVLEHRKFMTGEERPDPPITPPVNPHYSIKIQGKQILISTKRNRADFTPLFLYLNKNNRRVFVDFGKYETRFDSKSRRWSFRRLPISPQDYFLNFSRNIALQPYFFYRDEVYVFKLIKLSSSG